MKIQHIFKNIFFAVLEYNPARKKIIDKIPGKCNTLCKVHLSMFSCYSREETKRGAISFSFVQFKASPHGQ